MLTVGQIGGGGSSSTTSFSNNASYPTPQKDPETKKLCLKLRSSFSPEDWSNFESSLTPVRLGYFLENEQVKCLAHDMLTKFPSGKDKGKGIQLKTGGNKAFGAGDNKVALEQYTKCLAWMPHEEGSSDAAIVYANRSAALFHLAQYSLAERDALLAFNLGYPSELHYKLYERLARCCLESGRKVEASKHLQKAIHSLTQAKGLDETKVCKSRSALETLLKSCSISSSGKSGGNFSSTSNGDKDNISFAGGISGNGNINNGDASSAPVLKLPEVVGGRSRYLKACSQGLTLKRNEKKGRFVVANEAFKPGDVILVEKAFVSVLLPQHYHLQCFQCYAPLEVPVMCKSCIYISYCSTQCQEKAWRTHHQYECKVLGALKHSGISVICYMAMRILTQAEPLEALKWYNMIVQNQKKPSESSAGGAGETGDEIRKKDKPQTGDISIQEYKTDHSVLFNLVTHLGRQNAESDFHKIIMTAYLVNILKCSGYMGKIMEGGKLSAGEVELKIGLVLHHCLQFLQFNTHETSGWDPDLVKDNSIGLGGGLFPTLALFNHSCNPAIVRYFINDTVVVRTVRSIRPGEEVTENYGPCFITSGKEERKQVLWDQFWFECDCYACIQDWPSFDRLSNDNVRFRCEHCGAYICTVDENMGLFFKCGRCSKPVNILKNLQSLQESESKYTKAMEFLDKGDESNGLGVLLENIALLCRYLVPPVKDLHVCQEHVRKCLLNCGNKISKLTFWEPEKL